jgi:hypothetical protein
MRIINGRLPSNPLTAIGSDLRTRFAVEPIVPEANNRLTAALERAEGALAARRRDRSASSGETDADRSAYRGRRSNAAERRTLRTR